MPDKHFLIIEDEPDLAHLVALHLSELSAECVICHDGESGLQAALTGNFQVILLDLRLPGKDGLDVCRELRAEGVQTPVLMLTSRATELDRVLGLELGADDYLTKPFSNLELVARVKALMRRAQMGREVAPRELLQVGDLAINGRDRTVAMAGRAIECTAKEFDLLQHFARYPGKVFRRMDLLQAVWGYGHEGYEHTVNSHINRLRAKLEPDPTSPKYILTVWGVGYKFAAGAGA